MFSCGKKGIPSSPNINDTQDELIVLVAPSVNDSYYARFFNDIVAFQKHFARKIMENDRVVILVDESTIPFYKDDLPESVLVVAHIADIWIRDFAPVIPKHLVKFSYRPSYLSQEDAQWVEQSFEEWFRTSGLSYGGRSSIVLDGGNFVDNGTDKVIITKRIFEDNRGHSYGEIRDEIKRKTGLSKVAFIPYEDGDITGHADGMVMWIEQDKLAITHYEGQFMQEIIDSIVSIFGSTGIIELPNAWDGRYYDDFPSACGIYANGITTAKTIYLPVYNIPTDATVIRIVEANTEKKVVPVDASKVCLLGGSIRCLTWQVSGANAEKILSMARQK